MAKLAEFETDNNGNLVSVVPNKRYVPLTQATQAIKPNMLSSIQQHKKSAVKDDDVIPDEKDIPEKSKVLVIDNLSVTIIQDFDDPVDFKIDTKPGLLSDRKTIPNLDICAKEDIVFDDDITRNKIESIIRRCGILEEYKDYFVNDPEIIINSYTLKLRKKYRFFSEFKEGVLTGFDIFN